MSPHERVYYTLYILNPSLCIAVGRLFMLSNIIVFSVVFWVLGVATSHTLGGFIYLLLVIAAVAVIIRVIQRRRLALKNA